jgi:phosphoribosylamine--glycine ligase
LEGDLLALLAAAAGGDLRGAGTPQASGAAVTVALAAREYPARGDSGTPISGVEDAERAGALVFHAGTARHGSSLVTNGGRILSVTGVGKTVGAARTRAYAAIDKISFEGMRYRTDIAAGVDA